MTDQAWFNDFGAGLNIGVNVPTAVVGNGLDNHVGGSVGAVGGQQVGDVGVGHGGGFGGLGDINIGVNVPTVVAGNGVGNSIGGDVFADGQQHVGGGDFHAATPFGDINIGVNVPTVVAANGVGNDVGGDIGAIGHQGVGDFAHLLG
jgi:hypothetical protein